MRFHRLFLDVSDCHSFQLLIFRVVKGPFYEEFYQCVTYGFYTAKWQEQFYSILSLMLMFVIPLIVLVLTYSSALFKLRRELSILFFCT